MKSEELVAQATLNQREAYAVLERLALVQRWEAVGVESRLVGSLRMGLLAKHRDIDFHLYSNPVRIEDDFQGMSALAKESGIRSVEYRNLLDTEEACLEWHVGYEFPATGHFWQIDLIHIVKGTRYDGYFERMAEKVQASLTEEERCMVLALKFMTPDEEKVPGVDYYRAVLLGGVRDYAAFEEWRQAHAADGAGYDWWESL